MLFIPKERWICQLILCWGHRRGHCAEDARGCPVTCVTHAGAMGRWLLEFPATPVPLAGSIPFMCSPLSRHFLGDACCPSPWVLRSGCPSPHPTGLTPSQQPLNWDAVGVQGCSSALWHHISSLWVVVLEELKGVGAHGRLEKLGALTSGHPPTSLHVPSLPRVLTCWLQGCQAGGCGGR